MKAFALVILVVAMSVGGQPSEAAAAMTVKVVPPLQGIHFSLDGRTFESGPDGVARFTVPSGQHRLTVLPFSDEAAGLSAEFDRWGDDVFTAERIVRGESPIALEVGLRVRNRVKLEFVEKDGSAVPLSRIGPTVLRSNRGERIAVEGVGPIWVEAGRVTRRRPGLELAEATYSVETVTVDGSNVVNRGQQRFAPRPGDTWRVQLLFFRMTVTARGALLRQSSVGTGVNLVYPDGEKRVFSFDAKGRVRLEDLARGVYLASVEGGGYSPKATIVLSRDQEVVLVSITPADGILSGLLIASLLGLVLTLSGRWLRTSTRARIR